MDVYQPSNDSADHEFWLTKQKLTVCLIQYSSSSALNKTLSRQNFPWKMRQCKNYLTSMVPKNRNINDNNNNNDKNNSSRSNNNLNNDNDDKNNTKHL